MSVRRRDRKNVDTPDAKSTKKEPIRIFAEKVRDHKDFDSRWAVLEEVRVEYFRSKDFVELLKKHPGLMTGVLAEDHKVDDESRASMAVALLLKGLIVRCDRAVKTIRPGRKKLSKWPAKLEVHSTQGFADESFYAWNYEKTRPIWQTALSFLVPVVTVACCLFPVFPHWAKLTVLYTCLTFLILICGVLLLRWLVFGVIWILTGRSIWFLPNILAEEALLSELFRFMPVDTKEEEAPSKLLTRFVVALFTMGVIWLSFTHAPDGKARARYRKKVGNIIDDVLLWSPAMLAGNTTAVNQTVVIPKPKAEAEKGAPKPKLNDTQLAEEAARIIKEAGLLSDDDLTLDVELESESQRSEERIQEEAGKRKSAHDTEL